MDEIVFFEKKNWQGRHHHCYAQDVGGKIELKMTFGTTLPNSLVIKSGNWKLMDKSGTFTDPSLKPGLYNDVDVHAQINEIASVTLEEHNLPSTNIGEVILFDGNYFKGRHHHIFGINRGDGDPILLNSTMHNKTNSIIVISGIWGFLDSYDYKGTEFNRLGPGMYAMLHDFNIPYNTVSSVMLYGTTPEKMILNECIIFSDKDNHGSHHHIYGCDNNLSDSQMHHMTSSIVIKQGNWKFFGAPSYTGAEYWENNTLGPGLYSDVNNYKITDNAIDSIRVDVDPAIKI